jgi:hypothetical protein
MRTFRKLSSRFDIRSIPKNRAIAHPPSPNDRSVLDALQTRKDQKSEQ